MRGTRRRFKWTRLMLGKRSPDGPQKSPAELSQGLRDCPRTIPLSRSSGLAKASPPARLAANWLSKWLPKPGQPSPGGKDNQSGTQRYLLHDTLTAFVDTTAEPHWPLANEPGLSGSAAVAGAATPTPKLPSFATECGVTLRAACSAETASCSPAALAPP
jgi:hypothetical protein